MALSEQEEFELLSLEREKAVGIFAPTAPPAAPKVFDYKAFKEKGWGSGAEQMAYKAGDAVSRGATAIGLPAEVAGGLGATANFAANAVPALFGGGVAAKTAPVFEAGAKRLMSSALKPSVALGEQDAAKAIQTMLDEGINVSHGGLQKIRGKIADLNKQIFNEVMSHPGIVDKQAVYKPVKQAIDKFTMQANPNADVNAIKTAWDEFKNHPLLQGGDDIPVSLAQSLKQGTYRALGNKAYGELKGAEIEGQKAIARGLKDEITKVVPQVQGLNARESAMLNALDPLEHRVIVESRSNPMGLASFAVLHPTEWAAFMADRTGAFKSLIARAAYSGKEKIPAYGAATGIAAGEYVGTAKDRQ